MRPQQRGRHARIGPERQVSRLEERGTLPKLLKPAEIDGARVVDRAQSLQ